MCTYQEKFARFFTPYQEKFQKYLTYTDQEKNRRFTEPSKGHAQLSSCRVETRTAINLSIVILILDSSITEIAVFLTIAHGITISLRQLKRILQRRGLRRRGNQADLGVVIRAIEQELEGSRSCIGFHFQLYYS